VSDLPSEWSNAFALGEGARGNAFGRYGWSRADEYTRHSASRVGQECPTYRRNGWDEGGGAAVAPLRAERRGLSIGGDAAAGGPLTEDLDAFGHGDGKRRRALQGQQDSVGGQLVARGEGLVKGGDDGLLDLGAAVAFGRDGQGGEVELAGVAGSFADVDGEDLLARVLGGQIDEEDLVEAAFAEEFGRQGLDVVGGGDHEDGGGVLLHPSQHGGEHASGEAAVDALVGGGGHGLFDLVDPEDEWGHAFGLMEGLTEAAFGLADVAVVEGAHIHTEEGPSPCGGDGFGGEAFAGALDAEHEDAFGRLEAESQGVFGEGVLAVGEPVLEAPEAADFVEADGGLDVVEEAFAFEHGAFGGEHAGQVAGVELRVIGAGIEDESAELAGVEAAEDLDDAGDVLAAEFNLHAIGFADLAEGVAEDGFDLGGFGQGQLKGGGPRPHDGGKGVEVIDEDEVGAGAFAGADEVAEDAEGSFVLEVACEIEHDGHEGFDLEGEVIECGGGVFGVGDGSGVGDEAIDDAGDDGPLPEGGAGFEGDGADQGQSVVFLEGADGDAGVAGREHPLQSFFVLHRVRERMACFIGLCQGSGGGVPIIRSTTQGGRVAVCVDHESLAVRELGLRTVGEVLSHLQKTKRLVVQVVLDGQEPAVEELGAVRQTSLEGHSLYVETADPRELAVQVLEEVAGQIEQAGPMKAEAAELLQRNQPGRALEKLGVCLRAWHNAQESIVKTAELLRLDPAEISVEGRPLAEMLDEFAGKLRQIKSALEQRDFVLLSDVLLYETAEAQGQWQAAVSAMRAKVEG